MHWASQILKLALWGMRVLDLPGASYSSDGEDSVAKGSDALKNGALLQQKLSANWVGGENRASKMVQDVEPTPRKLFHVIHKATNDTLICLRSHEAMCVHDGTLQNILKSQQKLCMLESKGRAGVNDDGDDRSIDWLVRPLAVFKWHHYLLKGFSTTFDRP